MNWSKLAFYEPEFVAIKQKRKLLSWLSSQVCSCISIILISFVKESPLSRPQREELLVLVKFSGETLLS